jgi:flagellar basal body-associated protein FliL
MKKKKPILMMLAVLIVVAALAAVAVYGYSKAKPKKAVVAPTAATTMVAKVAPATTSNVDQATKDIDAALAKADTQKDVSSADLTDTTLGL